MERAVVEGRVADLGTEGVGDVGVGTVDVATEERAGAGEDGSRRRLSGELAERRDRAVRVAVDESR